MRTRKDNTVDRGRAGVCTHGLPGWNERQDGARTFAGRGLRAREGMSSGSTLEKRSCLASSRCRCWCRRGHPAVSASRNARLQVQLPRYQRPGVACLQVSHSPGARGIALLDGSI